jgi:hypothetical protein
MTQTTQPAPTAIYLCIVRMLYRLRRGDQQKALHAVVDELIAETVKGF